MNELSYQQRIVMEQVKERFTQLCVFTDRLRSRIYGACVASIVISCIITSSKLLLIQTAGDHLVSLLSGLVCLCSVMLFGLAAKTLMPADTPLAGSTDTDVLFDEYLTKDIESAYNNTLIDICTACDIASTENKRCAKVLVRVIWVFQIQIVVLAIVVVLSG